MKPFIITVDEQKYNVEILLGASCMYVTVTNIQGENVIELRFPLTAIDLTIWQLRELVTTLVSKYLGFMENPYHIS